MNESELAEKIINYFESKGYITYKEVSMYGNGGDARADIYFVKKVNEFNVFYVLKISQTIKNLHIVKFILWNINFHL